MRYGPSVTSVEESDSRTDVCDAGHLYQDIWKLSKCFCRTHHRDVHQGGDELKWWQQLNVDPLNTAQRLWQATRIKGIPALQAEARSLMGGLSLAAHEPLV